MEFRYPEEYGGSGLDYFAAMAVKEEIAARVVLALEWHLMFRRYGNKPDIKIRYRKQKEDYLVPSIAGEKIAALGITEPSAGSDVAGLSTTAKKTDGGWIINGSKVFITNGNRADFQILIAKTVGKK